MGLGQGIDTERWINIPVERLVRAAWNYKTDDDDISAALEANIKRNGQLENLIVRELETGYYEVVNGNHRLVAFQRLGIERCYCYNLGRVGQQQAQRVAIETNETRFDRNNVALSRLIQEIALDDAAEFTLAELAETMPFSADELKGMVDLLDFDWSQFQGEGGDGAAKPPTDPLICCPACGCEIGRGKLTSRTKKECR